MILRELLLDGFSVAFYYSPLKNIRTVGYSSDVGSSIGVNCRTSVRIIWSVGNIVFFTVVRMVSLVLIGMLVILFPLDIGLVLRTSSAGNARRLKYSAIPKMIPIEIDRRISHKHDFIEGVIGYDLGVSYNQFYYV